MFVDVADANQFAIVVVHRAQDIRVRNAIRSLLKAMRQCNAQFKTHSEKASAFGMQVIASCETLQRKADKLKWFIHVASTVLLSSLPQETQDCCLVLKNSPCNRVISITKLQRMCFLTILLVTSTWSSSSVGKEGIYQKIKKTKKFVYMRNIFSETKRVLFSRCFAYASLLVLQLLFQTLYYSS